MFKKLLSSIMCIALFCTCLVTFAACGEKHTYTEVQEAYLKLLDDYKVNTGDVTYFDDQGEVSIYYKNPKLVQAINDTTLDGKALMYSRLSSDLGSDQAVFEPALKASLLYVTKYIDVTPAKEVPSSECNNLLAKLSEFKDNLENLSSDISFLNIRGNDFDANGRIEKSFFKTLLNNYKKVLSSACNFSEKYIEVAKKYVWQTVAEYTDEKRVTKGFIERYYLEKLVENACVYVRGSLATFYNQSLIKDGKEYFTASNPARYIKDNLSAYIANAVKLADFEKIRGGIIQSEQAIIDAYETLKTYDKTFNDTYGVFNYSLNQAGNLLINLNEEYDPEDKQMAYRAVVKDFVSSEYAIISDLAKQIMVAVSNNAG